MNCSRCDSKLTLDEHIIDSKSKPIKLLNGEWICNACDSMDLFFIKFPAKLEDKTHKKYKR